MHALSVKRASVNHVIPYLIQWNVGVYSVLVSYISSERHIDVYYCGLAEKAHAYIIFYLSRSERE